MDLICFDLDNTLINSEKANFYAYNYALRKNRFSEWKFHDMVVLFGKPHEELISILMNPKDKTLIKKIKKDYEHILINKFYKYARVKKGVKKTLKQLSKRYLIAIVSNASYKSIISLLKGANLNKNHFSIIIGNDQVKHSKPYPDEILKAEKLIHHRAKCIIGDSIYDIIAGKMAKVKTIAILSNRYSKKKLIQFKPDYLVNKIPDILKIL